MANEWLAPQMLFIAWSEENRIEVRQVLNYKLGTGHNHMLGDYVVKMDKLFVRILGK